MKTTILIFFISLFCAGCKSVELSETQAEMVSEIKKALIGRDELTTLYPNSGAMRDTLKKRSPFAKETFRKNIDWQSKSEEQLEAFLKEVMDQIRFMQIDLTSLDGYMFEKNNANKSSEATTPERVAPQ